MPRHASLVLMPGDSFAGAADEAATQLEGPSREDLEQELAEIASALSRARANLELARVDMSRWALLLERAEGLASTQPVNAEAGRARREAAADEQREILRMYRGAHLRFGGCTSAIEALVCAQRTVGTQLGQLDAPRESLLARKLGAGDDPDAPDAA